jgi:hypothetical protein
MSVGQLNVGMNVHVLHVPKAIIPLSSSVKDPSVYPPSNGDGHRDRALRPCLTSRTKERAMTRNPRHPDFPITGRPDAARKGWRQEGLLRLLENVLSVGEDPEA